jgi:hypothetical protein
VFPSRNWMTPQRSGAIFRHSQIPSCIPAPPLDESLPGLCDTLEHWHSPVVGIVYREVRRESYTRFATELAIIPPDSGRSPRNGERGRRIPTRLGLPLRSAATRTRVPSRVRAHQPYRARPVPFRSSRGRLPHSDARSSVRDERPPAYLHGLTRSDHPLWARKPACGR